ncbi:methylated-DNA--[protein]-cysteine S-methyltransferase [Corynebacterium coyleae]|uniref:methylated-DNA--[protein]-cysteine S-methyltransferase n=1 Tax=Corynebacterium coyleae TaxID=53374 RepID=UPI000C76FD7D|nr:methylated-DNA--[protein]-cysteine S-methyltransferase [Corynebacterium coyleae]PLA27578.1 methylated-DNA--[protein]-cysteine S-methyltransferase [Corynebacterium coyleae]
MDTSIGQLGVVTSAGAVSRVLLPGDAGQSRIDDTVTAALATQQIAEYFAGELRAFDVPLNLDGVTEFRAEVLRALMEVPYGETTTYGELARAVGRPKAVRAVGSACATNPLPILIPCHRVLRSDGALGGYRGGTEAKRFLLALESIDV